MTIRFWIGVSLSLLSALAGAQYKYIGPDGKVVYSDTPPPANVKGVQKKDIGSAAGPAAAGASNLPYELGLAAKNFPVTLYTTPGCEGCDQGRAFLSKRGIPFAEKTITTNDDLQAVKKIAGSSGLPVMTIGNAKLLGFEPSGWGTSLDTAGYPPNSLLPPSYKAPPPTALAPRKPEVPPPAQPSQSPVEAQATAAAAAAPSVPAEQQSQRPGWFKGF